MDTPFDLGPATASLARVVEGIRDDQLTDPTPCTGTSVADLLDHVGGFTVAFAAAARKEELPGDAAPSSDGSRLAADWRDRIPVGLADLAEAWRDPAAYDGLTMAGPVEMPADLAMQVGLDEVLVHGWDLAVATGQDYAPDPASVEVCLQFVQTFEPPPGGAADDGGLFGPPVPVADDAPLLERLLGATGRDPGWTP